jgi:DNA polymerase III sliding clamp (beta) subunit (PCNA family)
MGAVNKGAVLDILKCVHIGPGPADDMARLMTTNLLVSLAVDMPVKIERTGAMVVPIETLLDLLTIKGVDDCVQLSQVSRTLKVTVSQGNQKSRLPGFPAHEFVELDFSGEDLATLPVADFIQALGWASSCASRSEDRPLLSNVYVHSQGGETHFVGTDGFRMAYAALPGEYMPAEKGYLIPNRGLVKSWRVYRGIETKDPETGEDLHVTLGDQGNTLTANFGHVRTSHRLTEIDHYVDYEVFFQQHVANVRIVLEMSDLLQALSIVRTISKTRKDFNKTLFSLRTDGDGYLFTVATRGGMGDVKTEIPLDWVSVRIAEDAQDVVDDGLQFILNALWVERALKHMRDAPRVALEYKSDKHGLIFRPLGNPKWSNAKLFMMPMTDDAFLRNVQREAEADESLLDDGVEEDEL